MTGRLSWLPDLSKQAPKLPPVRQTVEDIYKQDLVSSFRKGITRRVEPSREEYSILSSEVSSKKNVNNIEYSSLD